MKGDDTAASFSRVDFNGYLYGFDSVKDPLYEKVRTLESIIALAKGEVEQFSIQPVTTVSSPVVFEFVDFLKTDEGVRVANKWLETFEVTLHGIQVLAARLLLKRESFSCSDLIMLYQTIDIAIDNLTKKVIAKERLYRANS